MNREINCGKVARVAVIGLAGQSAFLNAEHFPAPGEAVACGSLFFEPGGKGYNQAVACARMGVETIFIGAVGEDENARACRLALEAEDVQVCFIEKNAPTAYAVITTIPDGENTVQVFGGASKCLEEKDLYEERILRVLKGCDYLLLQNELSADCLKAAVKLAKKLGISVILNPAPAENIPEELLADCELVTPNYGEAKVLLGFSEEDSPSEDSLVKAFCDRQVKRAVVTMGGSGALLINGEERWTVPAFSCGAAVDTTGAGDTFNGTFTAALAMNMDLRSAAEMAAIAAGISVTRPGAAGSIPSKAEVMKWREKKNEA